MKFKLNRILILLTILTGIMTAQPQLVDGVAAVVGDEIILLSDIEMVATQYAINNRIDPNQNPQLMQKIRQQSLENLINQKLMLLKAKDDTISVSEEEIDRYVKNQLNYLENKAGGRQQLEKAYNMSYIQIKNQFRKEIRNQLTIQRLRQEKTMSIKVSRLEIENFYHSYKDSLPQQDETVDLSHILLTPSPSDSAVEKARRKIQKIREMVLAGTPFENLAKQYSEDPGSAANGGELGWAERGSFVPEYEAAAFALKKGEVSDIIRSQFGFHIIKLLDRQGERILTQHILIRLNPTPDDIRRTADTLRSIKNNILSGKITFEEAALKYSQDPNVQKDKGHLGEYVVSEFKIPQFAQAVKTLKPGEISDPIKTDFGIHIIRLNSYTPQRVLDLNKDWDKISELAVRYKRERFWKSFVKILHDEYPIHIKM